MVKVQNDPKESVFEMAYKLGLCDSMYYSLKLTCGNQPQSGNSNYV